MNDRKNSTPRPSYYEPALDGLRFFAFLLVFVHHLPGLESSEFLLTLKRLGWIGVEVFFVVSAFIFFNLFEKERASKGRIFVGKFYARRVLRLYPLMLIAPLIFMFLGSERPVSELVSRYLGIMFFADNFLTWVASYNRIPFSAHLWTLSFEFQIYAVLPLLYFAYVRLATRDFLLTILAILGASFCLRLAFVLAGAPHPVIWVTPFLHLESVMAGLVLAVFLFKGRNINAAIPIILIVAASAALIAINDIQEIGLSTNILYPLSASIAVSSVMLCFSVPFIRVILALPVFAGLGRLSFGLYVFHLLAIRFARDILQLDTGALSSPLSYAMLFSLSLAICIGISLASYALIERPFLVYKDKLATVRTRSV